MQGGSLDPESLNPRRYLVYLKQFVSTSNAMDQVFVRRIIGSIFYALYNYWAAKTYSRGRRGDGPYRDSFRLSDFFTDMISLGLEDAIYRIFIYRVAADHYVLNPTKIRIITKPWKDVEIDVEISQDKLVKLLDLAIQILDFLEKS